MQATQSGELSQRFIEFVMMHAQNAALFLGQIPNPKTGEGEVNLELAKMFIDQLAMIQEKTRGNLSGEEAAVLGNTISNLQMVYVEVSQQAPKSAEFADGLCRSFTAGPKKRRAAKNSCARTETGNLDHDSGAAANCAIDRIRVEEEIHQELRLVS